jgi:stress responsive alpha/beta barrel protein
MIWHVVLMTPRPDLTPGERQALISALDRAIREIPSVRDLRVGRRLRQGPTYQHTAPDSPDFFVSIGFDDAAGLQAYLQHQVHDELARRFNQSLKSAWVFDFESAVLHEIA